ncbi:hypothetical protein CIB84_003017, partial [Bambusicola thoracicus]
GEIFWTENDAEKTHHQHLGPGHPRGSKAERSVPALQEPGSYLQVGAAIPIALGNMWFPLTLLVALGLPGTGEELTKHRNWMFSLPTRASCDILHFSSVYSPGLVCKP